jgi:hypothetical protein
MRRRPGSVAPAFHIVHIGVTAVRAPAQKGTVSHRFPTGPRENAHRACLMRAVSSWTTLNASRSSRMRRVTRFTPYMTVA